MNSNMWVLFTLCGAVGQTARNAMQRELTPRLGALGATLVRFLFGFPFALMFLAIVLPWTGGQLPTVNLSFALWTLIGASSQIGATALMLLTMEQRSFVVTVAYLKTEPLQVAILGLVFLGDPLSTLSAIAILTAMAGVALISIKAGVHAGASSNSMRPALLGLLSAALFAMSAIGYRGAILALHAHGYLLPATFSLAVGLTLQTVLLMAWLVIFKRRTLAAIFSLWRPVAAGRLCRRGGIANVVSGFRPCHGRQRAHPGAGRGAVRASRQPFHLQTENKPARTGGHRAAGCGSRSNRVGKSNRLGRHFHAAHFVRIRIHQRFGQGAGLETIRPDLAYRCNLRRRTGEETFTELG